MFSNKTFDANDGGSAQLLLTEYRQQNCSSLQSTRFDGFYFLCVFVTSLHFTVWARKLAGSATLYPRGCALVCVYNVQKCRFQLLCSSHFIVPFASYVFRLLLLLHFEFIIIVCLISNLYTWQIHVTCYTPMPTFIYIYILFSCKSFYVYFLLLL